MNTDLTIIAQDMQDYVVGIRRVLHTKPELRWEEEETLKLIKSAIENLFFKFKDGVQIHNMKGGIYVDVTFDLSFDRILLRSDVDAVATPENTGLPFASQNPGVSHACGHDTHIAMMLGAMKAIANGSVKPKYNLRFVFQRAEENPVTESGGASLVKEGVLDGIVRAFALHIFVEDKAKAGQFQTRRGQFLSNSGRMKITVNCEGGHVAKPHNGSNATDIMIDIGVALRGFALSFLGPNERTSFVPASLNSGDPNSSNIRPGEATIWYAVRHFLPSDKAQEFVNAIMNKVLSVVSGYPDAKVNFEYFPGHPSLTNDPETTGKVMTILSKAGEEVVEIDPIFGGEDFAHYLNVIPGNAMMLGAYQEGSGGHHSSTFNPDESILWKGVLYWLLLATN